MVIIKVNPLVRLRDMVAIEESIRRQAETGVIILPQHCELLNEVPADEEIKVIREDNRVAELEKELAAAMAWISANKSCDTCKHASKILDTCPCFCNDCRHEDCICRDCQDGEKWEWRGA